MATIQLQNQSPSVVFSSSTSRAIEVTKQQLLHQCGLYTKGEITQHLFGRRCRDLVTTSSGCCYTLSLFLKRLEKTLGYHICSFWSECDDNRCQYRDSSVDWAEDVALFSPVPPQWTTELKEKARQVEVNTHDIRKMQQDLQAAHEAIEELSQRLEETQTKANARVQVIESKMTHIMSFYDVAVKHTTTDIPAQMPAFQLLPMIDLSLPMAQVASDIQRACREVGFMYLVNHGISQDTFDTTFDFAKRFFDLPVAAKSRVALTNSRSGIRGYFRVGEENLDTDASSALKPGDFKEGFDVGRELSEDEIQNNRCILVEENQWLAEDELPGFRHALVEYERQVLDMKDQLLVAFAMGLGIPEDYFISRTRKPMATLRLLHYPPQDVKDDQAHDLKIGCGAHTDYGLCTILNQDAVGGLQVQNSQHEWIDVPYVKNSFVINIGDMMSRWTGGQYASTVHRVVYRSHSDRYSIPFFLNPDVGTIIEPLPGQRHRERTMEPMTSDQILLERYETTFQHIQK